MRMAKKSMRRTLFFLTLLVCSLVILNSCAAKPANGRLPSGNQEQGTQVPLTACQEYAGELLSYLLKVVLGRAGDPGTREEWKRNSLHERLDLATITRTMTDPEENISDVMVIDSNILALSRVVYYYDQRLSLNKNRDSLSSIYPAPELLGIRLLLLKKMGQGEKINLSALVEREGKILHQKEALTSEDLNAMNLTPDEMQLILDIIHREPHYFQYLKCPFLVNALHEVGVVRSDDFTRKKIGEANYQNYPCRPFGGSDQQDAIKIALLPSITKEFYRRQDHKSEFPPYGFRPTPFFVDMAQRLKKDILSRTKTLIHGELRKLPGRSKPVEGEAWENLWQRILRERISFTIQDQRPLVIYPGNVRRVLRDMRPSADFAIMILGKNVYLSMDIQEGDRFPHANRLYLDIMDIKHAQIQEEVDQVSRFIVSRLRDYLMTL